MNHKICLVEDGAEIALPAWIEPENKYGSVEGLDDDELASPAELERIYYKELWGPIWLLPGKKTYSPAWDNVDVDYNAFASVDFDRIRPEFDKARYKADRLKEELRDVIIMMQTLSGRLPRARSQVLKYIRKGIIDLEHIESLDMHELARLYLRARRLQRTIRRITGERWAMAGKQVVEALE